MGTGAGRGWRSRVGGGVALQTGHADFGLRSHNSQNTIPCPPFPSYPSVPQAEPRYDSLFCDNVPNQNQVRVRPVYVLVHCLYREGRSPPLVRGDLLCSFVPSCSYGTFSYPPHPPLSRMYREDRLGMPSSFGDNVANPKEVQMIPVYAPVHFLQGGQVPPP